MRTCIDRLIAQPRLGGQIVRNESEFIANRLDILRHEGTISNDAYLDSGAIQGALEYLANLVDIGVSQSELQDLLRDQLARATRLEEAHPGLDAAIEMGRDERQMAEPLLQLKSVSKSFKEVNVLKDIDLEIYNGQIIGLVGGNGAGKTTLLRLMTGVYRPTSGNVTYQNGKAIHEARENVGIVPESTGLYSKLTAWENIRYHSRIFGLDDETAWRRTSKFANELNMSKLR